MLWLSFASYKFCLKMIKHLPIRTSLNDKNYPKGSNVVSVKAVRTLCRVASISSVYTLALSIRQKQHSNLIMHATWVRQSYNTLRYTRVTHTPKTESVAYVRVRTQNDAKCLRFTPRRRTAGTPCKHFIFYLILISSPQE